MERALRATFAPFQQALPPRRISSCGCRLAAARHRAAVVVCSANRAEPTRRGALQRVVLPFLLPFLTALQDTGLASEQVNRQVYQMQAVQAYAAREFDQAAALLTKLIESEPNYAPWYEMRGQVLVDKKDFHTAMADYNAALKLTADTDLENITRLKVGRALALEGLSSWQDALQDYNDALNCAEQAGLPKDPYVFNSRGNCYSSLGQYAEARADYLVSAELFQRAKGLHGRNGGTTQRLDGAVFAASNAALMLAQLGKEDAALTEMQRVARRAPGSVDMRAALAAMYYSRGQAQSAEEEWQYACDMITVGCSKYEDEDWLTRVRRWPPVMLAKLHSFLTLQAPAG